MFLQTAKIEAKNKISKISQSQKIIYGVYQLPVFPQIYFTGMTKRMKPDEWRIRPVLPDISIRDPDLRPVVVGTISEKRFISKVMSVLSKHLPLDKEFQHLKRVNNTGAKSDRALILISVSEDLDQVMESLNPYVEELTGSGLEFPLKKMELYCDPPLSRHQFDKIRSVWPCHFHEDRNLESLLNRTRPDVWSEKMFQRHVDKIQRLLLKICDDTKSVALVVDPNCDAIVADVEDSSHKHPLRHAAMNAIDAVAHAQGGGAWPRDVGDVTLKDSNEKCYLLTGYDVYLSREPCCMCAMSLVHSRVGRIFFFSTGNEERRKFGALESAVKLHAVEGLNHSFDVFCVERTS